MILNRYLLAIAATAISSLLAMSCRQNNDTSISEIEDSFVTPPDSVRVAAYWYWISDNLSPQGAVKDLEAMKRAGITRAQIGMIGLDDVPYGDAHYNSDKWWETLHQALKTAGELDIEIGIFNCPGWSQSGGPWIAPEQSMRHIVSAETVVEGPGERNIPLPVVEGSCQDVSVIAYPTFENEGFSQTWTIQKTEGRPVTMDLRLSRPSIVRSAQVSVSSPIRTAVSLSVKSDGEWKTLKSWDIDRFNPQGNVGFDPYAAIIESLPETEVAEARVEIAAPGSGDISFTLSERPMVERSAEKQLAKMCQEPLPMWNYYMWDKAPVYSTAEWNIDPTKVVILTDSVTDGVLKWNVPEGRWVVSRVAMATTGVGNSPAAPDARGLEVDKLNSEHLTNHFDAYIGEILKRIPEDDRKTFRVVVEDSYETGGQNWTDNLAEIFEERYGYSPLPYLPVLKGVPVGDNDTSDRFLWDLRRLIADLVAYEYVGGLRKISNEHGLTTWLENYGHWGFPSEFLLYGSQSDEISGEYWSEGTLGDIENRAASSCGHIYGKPRVWAESCTAAGNPFGRYPNVMKQRVDRFFTEGINASLLHLVIHQLDTPDEPGIAAWFGNEFNRKNTWHDQMSIFTDYLRRCNYVLQQGRYVADVAYFIGEDAPKMTGECNPPLPTGYSFDYINADVLKNHARVIDGRLVLDSGMEYKVLVLPDQETMRPEMLECIETMVLNGLTVTGPKPVRSPSLADYPAADNKVRARADKMWHDGEKCVSYGKGKVWAAGTTLDDIFADLGLLPDMSVAEGEQMPLFIHRTLGDADIYFVANPTRNKISINPIFRSGKGSAPQLWDATTGAVRNLPEYSESGLGVTIPLQLDALESAFIVMRKDITRPSEKGVNYPELQTVADLTHNQWTLQFDAARRGPATPMEVDSLFDWSTSTDKSIAYYSGTAFYTTEFDMPDDIVGKTYIDLGNVMVMARVNVNGEDAGGVWTSPYRVDITPMLVPGRNSIVVEVVNTWRNRLIGDVALAPEERLTHTNIPLVNAGEPLQASGLLGPVKIITQK